MARFVAGDVVVVPFPFTDLASSKVRPAVVLATSTRDDILLCQLTSKDTGHAFSARPDICRMPNCARSAIGSALLSWRPS